jgi:hypothetical protein
MNYQPGVGGLLTETMRVPRHIAVVRIIHCIVVPSVAGLLVTGGGILISHPRLYRGKTGAIGTESSVDLPLPFIIGPSVWNPLFAWIVVLADLAYAVASFVSRHFRKDLLPAKADLTCHRVGSGLAMSRFSHGWRLRWAVTNPHVLHFVLSAGRSFISSSTSRCFALSGSRVTCER